MMLMISAGNFLTLYMGMELQSLALYVLAAFNRDNLRSTEAGLKYFVLGALSSGMLLYGISLIYGFTGSVEFARIASVIAQSGVGIGLIFGLVFLISGLAFKVSAAVGAIVSAAVLAHDFSDGINTVSIILRNKGDNRSAFGWLLVDAAAPVAGVASTVMLHFQQETLGLCLALFAGVFLYIGASDLLPESYHDHPTTGTTAMTIVGVLTVYAAVRLANL